MLLPPKRDQKNYPRMKVFVGLMRWELPAEARVVAHSNRKPNVATCALSYQLYQQLDVGRIQHHHAAHEQHNIS